MQSLCLPAVFPFPFPFHHPSLLRVVRGLDVFLLVAMKRVCNAMKSLRRTTQRSRLASTCSSFKLSDAQDFPSPQCLRPVDDELPVHHNCINLSSWFCFPSVLLQFVYVMLPSQQQEFDTKGWVVMPSLLSKAECDLLETAAQRVQKRDGPEVQDLQPSFLFPVLILMDRHGGYEVRG